jgi:16S rRNA (guanine966-N2)-methyltransferase
MLGRMKGSSRNADYSTVRIIAGHWGGRKLRFLAHGVRPTGDRVRETLFNWLTPYLPGARCLDLFAGSGVLGLEALSRGAAYAVLVERNRAVAEEIAGQIDALDAATAQIVCADARRFDFAAHGPFDVVFLDPPFDPVDKNRAGPGLDLADLCTLLERSGSLANPCRIYLEMDRDHGLPSLPPNWQTVREKAAGKVRYALAERSAPATAEVKNL